MDESGRTPQPAATGHKDRSVRLVLLGVLSILVGALCALEALIITGLSLAAGLNPELADLGGPTGALVVGGFFYALLAAVMIWCGIGSILARRWVRPIMLIIGWTWLTIGLFTLVFLGVFLPSLIDALPSGAGGLPPEAKLLMIAVLLLVMAVIFVVTPGIIVVGYSARDVRLTCEAKNPSPCWTDGVPLSVLGLSVAMGFGAVSMAPYGFVVPIPVFGWLAKGLAGGAITLAVAVWSAWLAYSTYRLRMAGWWGSVTLLLVGTASFIMTFLRMDVTEIYRAMGYPERQIELMRGMLDLFPTSVMIGMGLGWSALFLIYLLSVRRHFVAAR